MTRQFQTTLVTHGAHYTVEVAENELADQRSITLSTSTVLAFQDRGSPEPRLERRVLEAQALLDRLASAGIDYHDLTETLEVEGVEKFTLSFEQLLSSLERKILSVASV